MFDDRSAITNPALQDWFARQFPAGPTDVQNRAWQHIAGGANALISAPTGTGKTLAAFLAIVDRLMNAPISNQDTQQIKCVYVSPLRSLGYDIEKNLKTPLRAIDPNGERASVAVRTGDTPAAERALLRHRPPHILITTPESLSLLLSQPLWVDSWRSVAWLVVDEIHALMPTKRGADLALSLERLAGFARADPQRVGLSATCRPLAEVARFLGGDRKVAIVDASPTGDDPSLDLRMRPLFRPGENIDRAEAYRRLVRSLGARIRNNRTTIVFANTRALSEKLTHDLRVAAKRREAVEQAISAHHSALDGARRHEVEHALKTGGLRGVVTSTSLELGVDIGSIDQAILIGPPQNSARCLQRVGRAGHCRSGWRRGVILASTPAEVVASSIAVRAARLAEIEPTHCIAAPLDVLCQQLLAMSCAREFDLDAAFAMVRRAAPFATLTRFDFDSCVDFLAGRLDKPQGEPRHARIAITENRARVLGNRVMRWLWSNIGTINSEDRVSVVANGRAIGTIEASYVDGLNVGDRFLLGGLAYEYRVRVGAELRVKAHSARTGPPRWTSDRQGFSSLIANRIAQFHATAGTILINEGVATLEHWLTNDQSLDTISARIIARFLDAQAAQSEIPPAGGVLVEEHTDANDHIYSFHVPLGRAACEALSRAIATRVGRAAAVDVRLCVADLGWAMRLPLAHGITFQTLDGLWRPDGFESDLLEAIERGDLLARRFRHVASTALLVLKNRDGHRVRVGGADWVSNRLYPLLKERSPDHPLIRETRREVMDDLFDAQTARRWLETSPMHRYRILAGPSPFTLGWIDSGSDDAITFESPADALRRLHRRLHLDPQARVPQPCS